MKLFWSSQFYLFGRYGVPFSWWIPAIAAASLYLEVGALIGFFILGDWIGFSDHWRWHSFGLYRACCCEGGAVLLSSAGRRWIGFGLVTANRMLSVFCRRQDRSFGRERPSHLRYSGKVCVSANCQKGKAPRMIVGPFSSGEQERRRRRACLHGKYYWFSRVQPSFSSTSVASSTGCSDMARATDGKAVLTAGVLAQVAVSLMV